MAATVVGDTPEPSALVIDEELLDSSENLPKPAPLLSNELRDDVDVLDLSFLSVFLPNSPPEHTLLFLPTIRTLIVYLLSAPCAASRSRST